MEEFETRTITRPVLERLKASLASMAADTEKMTESMSHLSYTKYYVHASEGYVVICQADHETVYCETSIRVEHLPEELQSGLKEGIALCSDEELYEFLENYSS